MYPLNKHLRLSMSISVFCMFLSACGGQGDQVTPKPPELANKTEVSTVPNKKSSVITLGTLKAFPTAEGAGAGATGGRGGKVVYVTNTNEKGAGSLFEAVTGYGNEKRTIAFAVGGRFNVSTWEWTENVGNFTLAGQTANDLGGVHIVSIPYHENSQGIQYKYYQGAIWSYLNQDFDRSIPANGSLYLTHSDNMAIRYISAKGGWESGIHHEARFNAFGTKNCTNLIYDHYSSGFSSYLGKLGGTNRNTGKEGGITMQYSLGHEGVAKHGVGFVLGAYFKNVVGARSEKEQIDKWRTAAGATDFHHNAFILNTHRHTGNIVAGDSGRYKRISNYIYGVGSRLDSFNGNMQIDYVNNVYEASNVNDVHLGYLHKFEIANSIAAPGIAIQPSLYLNGNKVVKQDGSLLISAANQWSMISMKPDESMGEEYRNTPLWGKRHHEQVPDSPLYHRTSAIKKGKYPITVTPTDEVKNYVLNNAGAGVRFNLDGTTYNDDQIDLKYISIAKEKSGPSNDDELGNKSRLVIPNYVTTKRNLTKFDSDRDGMADSWEKKHGLKVGAKDNNAVKRDWTIQGYSIKNNAGYTNLEIYLAELAGDFHLLAKK